MKKWNDDFPFLFPLHFRCLLLFLLVLFLLFLLFYFVFVFVVFFSFSVPPPPSSSSPLSSSVYWCQSLSIFGHPIQHPMHMGLPLPGYPALCCSSYSAPLGAFLQSLLSCSSCSISVGVLTTPPSHLSYSVVSHFWHIRGSASFNNYMMLMMGLIGVEEEKG